MKRQVRRFRIGMHVGKRLAVTMVVFGLLSAIPYVAVTHGQTPAIGVTSLTRNPLQIALLHWYDANLTTSFPVGSST